MARPSPRDAFILSKSILRILWLSLMMLGFVPTLVTAQSITVFAASSLSDVFAELGQTFQEQAGTQVVFNFSASSTLATQISEGAPADVFASADLLTMSKAGLEAYAQEFAQNKLVVMTNNSQLQTLADLATADYLLVLAAPEVPAGKYAREILANLETLYGAGYASKVLDHLVSNEASVRQAASKVTLGEADAAMVYATDVNANDVDALDAAVRTLEIPAPYNVTASYQVAVLPTTQYKSQAQEFVDFIMSKEGQDILRSYGFLPPQ
jgi:molybdate transport system substrate-binding protein